MHQDSTIKGLTINKVNGKGLKILIVHTRWNSLIVDNLLKGAMDTLVENGVDLKDIVVKAVPGSFELPFATKALLKKGNFHAAISIGVLIKGSTMHFEYIADATAHGLMNVGLELNIPVIFGVLTCLTDEQAKERAGIDCGKGAHNHGIDWAGTAIEMALISS